MVVKITFEDCLHNYNVISNGRAQNGNTSTHDIRYSFSGGGMNEEIKFTRRIIFNIDFRIVVWTSFFSIQSNVNQ